MARVILTCHLGSKVMTQEINTAPVCSEGCLLFGTYQLYETRHAECVFHNIKLLNAIYFILLFYRQASLNKEAEEYYCLAASLKPSVSTYLVWH